MADKKDLKKEDKFQPSYDLDKAGVHPARPDVKGQSTAGMEVRSSNKLQQLSDKMTTPVSAKRDVAAASRVMNHSAKQSHLKQLHQLIHMPKPNLPKSEGAVVGGTSTGAPAKPANTAPHISVNMGMGMGMHKSLGDMVKKPVKAIIDGFAQAGAAAAGQKMPEQPKPQPKPVKKVDPQTRLPGTLFEKAEDKPTVASVLEKLQAIEETLQKADIMAQPIDRHLKGLHKLLKGNPADMQQGVHTPVQPNSGQSHAGAAQQASGVPSIASHKSKLNQLKQMPKPNLPKSELQKDGSNQPPPPPPSGAQAAQQSMRDAFHFGKAESLEDGLNKPQVLMSEANPDEKQDAKLGENVEHLVEDHMIANKPAEQKEGHKIFQKNAIQHNLKALKRCLDKCDMQMSEMGKPLMPAHDSAAGGPTQDEPKENRMNSENMQKADEKGVHAPRGETPKRRGTSKMGKLPEEQAKPEAKRVLAELKNMPKPNLPKSEEVPKEEQPKPKDTIKDMLDIIERKK
jgi:hypothetical protein